jgi:hypothetical protein
MSQIEESRDVAGGRVSADEAAAPAQPARDVVERVLAQQLETVTAARDEAREALTSVVVERNVLRDKRDALMQERDDLIREFDKVKYVLQENHALRMTQKPLVEALGAEVMRRLLEHEQEKQQEISGVTLSTPTKGGGA